MNLEQRLEAVEKALADLTLQQKTAAELSSLIREVTNKTIRGNQRPGGLLSNKNCEATVGAAYEIRSEIGYSNHRDRLLDVATTLTLDEQCLSRL